MLCGLGLSHHLTSVLIAGPLSVALLLVLVRTRRWSPSLLLVALAGVALPLLSYASLYFKALHPSPAVWFRLEPTWASLEAHVTGEQYHGLLGHFSASASQARTLARYVYPFLIPALVIMLLVALRSKRPVEQTVLWALVGAVTVQLSFCFSYGVPDPTTYFLPPLAIALASFTPAAAAFMTRDVRVQRSVAWAACAVALVAIAQFGNWLGIAIGRREILVRLDENVRKVWTAIPLERGIVLWGGDLFHRCNAYQVLQGEKPGLHLVSPYELAVPLAPARFTARFGFDPFGAGGVIDRFDRPPKERGPRYDAFLGAEARRLHETTNEPVVILSPSSESVQIVGAQTPLASAPTEVMPTQTRARLNPKSDPDTHPRVTAAGE